MVTRSFVGQTIGKYEIVELLGRGGMAEVYKGYQNALDRHVAIKLMHAFLAEDQDFLNRFQREARAMAALNHPHIVSVYDFDVAGETYYIVMEFVSGGTLKERLEALASEGKQLSLANTVQIVLEIADALAYAHGHGMVHRDIKPGNIMLSAEGKAVLTDFGIAKILSGPSYTATGAMIGTPAYMSPEQGKGQPGDERSDLYSLGVLFFQMATGRLPYDADTPLAVVLKHVNEPVPSPTTLNPNIPAEIQDIIFKSMAKDANERFQSAHDMARALRDVVKQTNLGLAQALPAELLHDRPTPAPLHTVAGQTYSGEVEATRLAVGGLSLGGVGLASTVVADGPFEATTVAPPSFVPPTPAAQSGRRLWWLVGGFIGLLLLVGLVVGGVALAGLTGSGDEDATAVVAGDQAANTPTITHTPSVTPTPFDVAAEVAAALTEVAANQPTATSSPTPSATPTPTETPDATATFVAGCVYDAELVTIHTYQNQQSKSAPVGANFPITWVLRNSGTCPWPAGLQLRYQAGTEFGDVESVAVSTAVAPGQEVTVQATFRAPSTAGNYEAEWQLLDGEGEPLGERIEFSLQVYVPTTPTPTSLPAVPTPAASPTSAVAQPVHFHYEVAANTCEYVGDDWRCLVRVTPSGGGGGPYTMWVFDTPQGTRYHGPGMLEFWATGRRCFAWINNVRVADDASTGSYQENVYVDPDRYFAGGCTVP